MSKGITLDISRAMLVESSDYLPHNALHQRQTDGVAGWLSGCIRLLDVMLVLCSTPD